MIMLDFKENLLGFQKIPYALYVNSDSFALAQPIEVDLKIVP